MGRSCEQTLNASPGAPEPPWTGCSSKSGGSGHVAYLTNKWLSVDPESFLYQESCSLDEREEGRIVARVGLEFGAPGSFLLQVHPLSSLSTPTSWDGSGNEGIR